MIRQLSVTRDENMSRLDKFLSFKFPQISRSKLSSLINNKLVLVNGNIKKNSYRLRTGDVIRLEIPESDSSLKPFEYNLEIIWEDEDILVVNKPGGLVVHPHGKNNYQTMVNALLYMQKNLYSPDPARPGVVHRLDKETSGVIVLAKSQRSYRKLVESFKRREVEKEYYALVWGRPESNQFKINLPLRRSRKNRLKMEIGISGSKTALTNIKVFRRFSKLSLLKVYPKTGRMHQIRTHLKFLGFPIAGDKKYGINDKYLRLLLHAKKLKFPHPAGKGKVEFIAELPEYFERILSGLKGWAL